MASTPLDISWQVLRGIVQDWAGPAAELEEVQPLHGGFVNTTVALRCRGGERAVLKITPHRVDRSHAEEECQLAALRAAGVPVPRVYGCVIGTLDHPFSYILMEHVDGVDLAEAKRRCPPDAFDALQAELAEIVRRLHGHTGTHYGRVSPSEPTRYESWPSCYRAIFDPIWHDVEKSGLLPPKCRKTVAKVHERLDRLLAHDDCPRLVHWDLWATNVLARPDADGRWHVAALLDPACKYAHCEAELAYMELFHTVNGAFLRAYQGSQRLTSDYHRIRKPVYQLYAMLNHLHCFGQEYVKPAIGAIERAAVVV